MVGFVRFPVLLAGIVVLSPAVVFAQASITGIVKDASGAVIPGATVEATSPALIEKGRSVVTDRNGGYRIVDLRPGPYSVTFALPGFNTLKRDGIELTGFGQRRATLNLDIYNLTNGDTVTGTNDNYTVLWRPTSILQARFVKISTQLEF